MDFKIDPQKHVEPRPYDEIARLARLLDIVERMHRQTGMPRGRVLGAIVRRRAV